MVLSDGMEVKCEETCAPIVSDFNYCIGSHLEFFSVP
jgi:hypothetical protein